MAQERKARSARKRRAAEREAKDRIFQRLVRKQKRHRGETGLPQIITHATAERWKRQPCGHRFVKKTENGKVKIEMQEIIGRVPKNRVVVVG